MYEDFFEASRVESMLGTSHFVSGSSHMSFLTMESLSIWSYIFVCRFWVMNADQSDANMISYYGY